jgi:hypothetical protein
LLEAETQHQLLKLKELQQKEEMLLHRQKELSPIPSLESLSPTLLQPMPRVETRTPQPQLQSLQSLLSDSPSQT